jgi:hypothetical protein
VFSVLNDTESSDISKLAAALIPHLTDIVATQVSAQVQAALNQLPVPGTSVNRLHAGHTPAPSIRTNLIANLENAVSRTAVETQSDNDEEDDEPITNTQISFPNMNLQNVDNNELVKSLAVMDIGERMAPQVLAKIALHNGFVNWCRLVQWNNNRSKNEVMAWCQMLDVLLAEGGVTQDSVALEIAVRRICGVHSADTFKNWSLCDAVQYTGPNETLMPRAHLSSAMKQATQMTRLQQSLQQSMKPQQQFQSQKFNGQKFGFGGKPNFQQQQQNQSGNRGQFPKKSGTTEHKNAGGANHQ